MCQPTAVARESERETLVGRKEYKERKKPFEKIQKAFLRFILILVGARGFEPPTPCTPCKCATRLRYAPRINGYGLC